MKDWGKLSHFGIFDEIIRKASFDHETRNEENVIHAIEYIEAGLPPELRTGGCDNAPLAEYNIKSVFEEKLRTNRNGRQIHNKKPYRPLDLYKSADSVANCEHYFSEFKVLSHINDLEGFIYDLFLMAKYLDVSIFGLIYLESLRSDPYKLLAEFYVFAVIWEEPWWWRNGYKQLLDSVEYFKIYNLAFNKSKNYIDRNEYLKQILPNIMPNNRILLFGVPGNGKTQLAIEVCYISILRNMNVVWCDASTESSLLKSYVDFLSAIGNSPSNSSTSGIIMKISEWCCRHDNWLFVFDNYDSDSYSHYETIENLLPKSTNGCFLFSSIKKENISDITYIQVDCFSKKESYEFISNGLDRQTTKNDLNNLVRRLGNHPLALMQAISYLNKNPSISVGKYIGLLDDVSISFHEEKSGDSQHKTSLYASVITNIKGLLGKSFLEERACLLLFILSYFPECGISGHFLNRTIYYPYRYSSGNYEIDGDVVKPFFYSNSGEIAIDQRVKRILDHVRFKIYDKKFFFQLIEILTDSGLCEVLYEENDPVHANAYFGTISCIRTHKLLQESAREFLNTSEVFKRGDFPKSVIDLLIRLLYFASSAYKPYVYYGEIIQLRESYNVIMRNIINAPYAIDEYNYGIYCGALMTTSTIDQLVTNYITHDCTGCVIPFEQFMRWELLFEVTQKFQPEAMVLREFEYCSLFSPLKFEESYSHIESGLSLLRDILYDRLFSSIEDPAARASQADNICKLYAEEINKAISSGNFREYRDAINNIIFANYEILTDVKDRASGGGFGIIKILDVELVSEITKIFEANNINVVKLGKRVTTVKDWGFTPYNNGERVIEECGV